jgi:hypothetical protein
MSNNNSCTHIKVTGVRCNSPALRGEQFCYFHQNAHRGVRRPKQSRLHPIALIEDEESIQYALMEVINALMRNTIDVKRATLIIRALHIAVKNAARVKFGIHAKDAVTQVSEYAPPTAEQQAVATESELPAVSAIPYKPVDPRDRHFWEYSEEGGRVLAREAAVRQAAEANAAMAKPTVGNDHVGTACGPDHVGTACGPDHVGTAAFGRPASEASVSVGTDAEACPERGRRILPGREATVPPPAAATTPKAVTSPAAEVPPHDFKKIPQPEAPPQRPPQPSRFSKAGNPGANPAPRKPPATVKPAPKERKSAAHAARRG